MTLVHVAIPVLKGRTVFVVDRGRPWSVVEHILLEALAREGWTASELATAAAIPRRVVVEALVRLMRAGWVGVAFDQGSTVFRATARGIAVAPRAELPKATELKRRPTNYVIDLVSGEMFRNRDLLLASDDEVKQLEASAVAIRVEPASWHTEMDLHEALEVLLDPGETVVNGQPGGVFRRWVTVAVRDGAIVGGLPEKRTLQKLRSVILEAANRRLSDADSKTGQVFNLHDSPRTPQPRQITYHKVKFDNRDLVLDGPAHQEIFEKVLKDARSTVFIHSTFISAEHVLKLLPQIDEAVRRGVRVNVFWGQNESLDGSSSTQAAIATLRNHPSVERLNDKLIFSPYSTGSHAKFLIADTHLLGEYVAVVGSCNWFVSSFTSYEVSVVLRDPRVVSDLVGYFARLSCAHDGVWSDLATDIARISMDLAKQPACTNSNANVAIVTGGHHNEFVAMAKDEAQHSVFVASHRLGAAARPGIVAPLVSAAARRNVASEVYFGRYTPPVKDHGGAQLIADAKDAGVDLKCVESPRLHAKVLAWDSDCLLATSLNWLSADQVHLQSLKELGVFVRSPGVAEAVVGDFRARMK